jgi:hypothetical protein
MTTHKPRVLFVGKDFYGSNATSLRNAIVRRGHDCLSIPMWQPSPVRRILQKAGLPSNYATGSDLSDWNERLSSTALAWRPDIVLVFKGLSVHHDAVAAMPGIKIHYHPDDSSNPYNRSAMFDGAEPYYDLHVTTKSHNVAELHARGIANALFLHCAYDRDWHLPVHGHQAYDVGFIGTRRPDRVDLIRRIAGRWGKRFALAGGEWNRDPYLVRHASVTGPRYGLDLSLAVAAAPVQLGLLNSDNRDQHTCRSYEVPAAGGVLLAERTAEHATILGDERSGFLFDGEEDLFAHIERLAADTGLIAKVGSSAAAHVRSTPNTYEDRWDEILRAVAMET